VYPAQSAHRFQGGRIAGQCRFNGKRTAIVVLSGSVGKEGKEFGYDISVPERTGDDKAFVEQLWARRKVGYLLDQIRANGEKKELVEEVVTLAKRYGITTPYTSYLIVPDGVAPVVTAPGLKGKPGHGVPKVNFGPVSGAGSAPVLESGDPKKKPTTVETFARLANAEPGQLAQN